MPSFTAVHGDQFGGLPPRASWLRPSRRTRAASLSSDSMRTSSTSSSTKGQFQMMYISISILVLEGLIMECNMSKEQATFALSDSMNYIGSQTLQRNVPITAVISCFKNLSGNKTIATHVPSLPVGFPKEPKNSQQFMVRWPVDYDPSGDALSTFRCNRLMKKENPIQYEYDQHDNFAYGYDAEEIELNICLMRGSEMITLGAANLVVTGEETEEITVDIPIDVTKGATRRDKKARSPSPLRRTGSKLFGSKSSNKIMKSKAFPSDPSRKYKLSEHSMIRLSVKIHPASQPSPSFDEFGQEPDENLYPSSYPSHPNVQELRPTNPAPPFSWKSDKQNINIRSKSNPRQINNQSSSKRNVNTRSSSVTVKPRTSMYDNDFEYRRDPNLRQVPSRNSRQGIQMSRNTRGEEMYHFTREERGNGCVPQEYQRQNYNLNYSPQRQNYHTRSRTPASQPPLHKRSSSHKRIATRNRENTLKMEQKCTKTLFETILSHGASFLTGVTEDSGDVVKSPRKYYSSKGSLCQSRSASVLSSSSSDSEYCNESVSSSFESSRREGRGRSPRRRRH